MPRSKKKVAWYNVNSIATSVCIETEATITKVAAWLQKNSDFNHINITKLDAVIKGQNLALKVGRWKNLKYILIQPLWLLTEKGLGQKALQKL